MKEKLLKYLMFIVIILSYIATFKIFIVAETKIGLFLGILSFASTSILLLNILHEGV